MILTGLPTPSFDAWVAELGASDAGATHRAVVELRFEIDLSAPPGTPDHEVRRSLLAVVSRFDRDALLERVDYEGDRLLPGDVRLVGATAEVVARGGTERRPEALRGHPRRDIQLDSEGEAGPANGVQPGTSSVTRAEESAPA